MIAALAVAQVILDLSENRPPRIPRLHLDRPQPFNWHPVLGARLTHLIQELAYGGLWPDTKWRPERLDDTRPETPLGSHMNARNKANARNLGRAIYFRKLPEDVQADVNVTRKIEQLPRSLMDPQG